MASPRPFSPSIRTPYLDPDPPLPSLPFPYFLSTSLPPESVPPFSSPRGFGFRCVGWGGVYVRVSLPFFRGGSVAVWSRGEIILPLYFPFSFRFEMDTVLALDLRKERKKERGGGIETRCCRWMIT